MKKHFPTKNLFLALQAFQQRGPTTGKLGTVLNELDKDAQARAISGIRKAANRQLHPDANPTSADPKKLAGINNQIDEIEKQRGIK